jgi:hypothetical protein
LRKPTICLASFRRREQTTLSANNFDRAGLF